MIISNEISNNSLIYSNTKFIFKYLFLSLKCPQNVFYNFFLLLLNTNQIKTLTLHLVIISLMSLLI